MTSTAPGWHPDPETGGTRYWDGSRWTGDARPPRRPFAAASHHVVGALAVGLYPGAIGLILLVTGAAAALPVLIPIGILVLAASAAGCVYFLRGRGPTTQDVEARLEAERKAAAAKRRRANLWGAVAGIERLVRPRSSAPGGADAAATQIEAISDPQTAQALQNLQKLLYSRIITDAEFEAAKAKLVGPADDAFAQLMKLTELHEAGILGDLEFSSAKAKALGL